MMRGIVNTDLNERERPTVNSRIMQFYAAGDIVEIEDTVLGDQFDGDDVWFKLANGAFVWNGAVDVQPDASKLSEEDRNQWLILYREIDDHGRPNMFSKFPPKSLYFTPVRLPADSASIRVNDLIPDFFVDGVVKSVVNLDFPRDHVFVYIHGYQLLSSLKLDLLAGFVQNYMMQPINSIAKVIFMSWPAQGGPSRKTVDDRSLKAGQEFTANGLFETFEKLSKALEAGGKTLNLIVHSFGHQLLNGMLNPAPEHEAKIPERIFKNVFLMAPDVTHLTVKNGGETIKNYFQDSDGIDFHYDYSKLKKLAHNVHVFHDKYDYLLYSSTKKFVGPGNLNNVATPDARFTLTKNYRNLGNFGDKIPEPIERVEGINFFHVDDLVGDEDDATNDFPFRRIRRSARRKVDDVWTGADYGGINTGSIIFNLKRFPNHHRYLFTSKKIVFRVLDILS